MHNLEVDAFSVKYVRTGENNWVACLNEEEVKDFAIQYLLNTSILNLAAAIKKWMDCGVVGDFCTAAALNYYSKIDRVRNYLGKKGNRYVDRVGREYIIETSDTVEMNSYPLTVVKRKLNVGAN